MCVELRPLKPVDCSRVNKLRPRHNHVSRGYLNATGRCCVHTESSASPLLWRTVWTDFRVTDTWIWYCECGRVGRVDNCVSYRYTLILHVCEIATRITSSNLINSILFLLHVNNFATMDYRPTCLSLLKPEWILGRLTGGIWMGFRWLRVGTGGDLLRIRWWIFGFLRHGVA